MHNFDPASAGLAFCRACARQAWPALFGNNRKGDKVCYIRPVQTVTQGCVAASARYDSFSMHA